ncbi:Transcriptional regulator, TetR family [Pediococcus claussenii ATCC BAA-344]|uniref:Transcriptional regulator, TetR family n=2 Tax=Pediococcus claussenii TaxID=187452 RepID=G8PBH1_PEDCP|nr:Transcriptional regulator, TetR family [Pediococcus claussenii ATCC BAA-344]ANZ69448.1 hypothetical protein AYR57_03605 [Pediococcus claussenii]ANZ71268.1 hypothetical protein AYR58_03620 [Pediococcus claussenii]KRN20566.1 hypothetical protein IV79_GL000625 [Pediococcus claussenii]
MDHTDKYQKTERQIEDALLKLVQEKTFNQITVRDLTDTAKVGRSTFYEHYYDKYELLDNMVDRYSNLFAKVLSDRFDKQKVENLTAESLEEIVDQLAQNRYAIVILLHLDVEGSNLSYNFRSVLRAAVQESLFTAEYAQNTGVPSEYLNELYTNIAYTQIEWQLEQGKNQRIVDLSNKLIKMYRTDLDD